MTSFRTILCGTALLGSLTVVAVAADYTVKITDAAQIAGIKAACEALGSSCDDKTVAAYFQARMVDVANSYAKQFDTSGQKKDEFLATLPQAKRDAVEAELAK